MDQLPQELLIEILSWIDIDLLPSKMICCKHFYSLNQNEYFWRRVVEKNFPEFFPSDFVICDDPNFPRHSEMWKINCRHHFLRKKDMLLKFTTVMGEKGENFQFNREDFPTLWFEKRQLFLQIFGQTLDKNLITCDARPLVPKRILFESSGLSYPEFEDTKTERYFFFNFTCQVELSCYRINYLMNLAYQQIRKLHPEISLHDPEFFVDNKYFE